jgi:hypothetical protein
MKVGGPPFREPTWGFGPGAVVATRRLGFSSVALASFIEAISRGRAMDGFIVTSDVQRTIGTSGANPSFLDMTSYVLPVTATSYRVRMAPSGAPPAGRAHGLRMTRSLARARGTL